MPVIDHSVARLSHFPLSDVRRKTIYEYHKVDTKDHPIANNTAIIFTAQPSKCPRYSTIQLTNIVAFELCAACAVYTSCGDCVTNPKKIDFQCSWCPKLARCSDGFDRNRQDWVKAECDNDKLSDKPTTLEQCKALTPVGNTTTGKLMINDEHHHRVG